MDAGFFIEELQKKGYRQIKTGIGGIYAFKRKKKGTGHVVGVVSCKGACPYSGQMLNMLEESLGVVYKTRNILFVVFTDDDLYGARCALEGNMSHWIFDERNQKLIIYDNQPGKFFGVDKILEAKPTGPLTRYVFTCNNFIIAVNVIVFIVLEIQGNTYSSRFLYEHGGITPASLFEYHQIYRLFTSMFLHAGIRHLINNMVVLFFIGESLEKETGRLKYLLIYFASGIAGGIVSQLYYRSIGQEVLCVGASGAIFGTIGAMIAVAALNRGRVENFTLPRLILYVVLSIYLGVTSVGVSVSAHIGGLVTGFLLAMLLYRKRGFVHEN